MSLLMENKAAMEAHREIQKKGLNVHEAVSAAAIKNQVSYIEVMIQLLKIYPEYSILEHKVYEENI